MVSTGGNFYSLPDATRQRMVKVRTLAKEIQIVVDGALIAAHPVLEGRNHAALRRTPEEPAYRP